MSKTEGIRGGALWGFGVLGAYLYAYIAFGIYAIWQTPPPATVMGWLGVIASSLGYIAVGIIGLIPVLLIAIYLIVRDRNLLGTLLNHWPLVLAFAYPFLPSLPGPLDDVIVSGLAVALEIWFVGSRALRARRIASHAAPNSRNLLN